MMRRRRREERGGTSGQSCVLTDYTTSTTQTLTTPDNNHTRQRPHHSLKDIDHTGQTLTMTKPQSDKLFRFLKGTLIFEAVPTVNKVSSTTAISPCNEVLCTTSTNFLRNKYEIQNQEIHFNFTTNTCCLTICSAVLVQLWR